MERTDPDRRRRLWRLPALGLLAVATLLSSAGGARATLAVSPANLRLALDGARPSGTFTVTNTGEEPARYRAKAVHFELTEAGGIRVLAPNEHSLTTWIRFNPTEFDIPPKSSRVVRYTLLTPKEVREGEYWGAIEFEPLLSTDSKVSDDDGRTMNLKVYVSTLVPIFGTRGKPRLGVEATSASIAKEKEAPVLKIRLRNSGMARVDVAGRFELRDGSDQKVGEGELPAATLLLRGGERVLSGTLPADLRPGTYKVRLRLEAPTLEKAVEAELPVVF